MENRDIMSKPPWRSSPVKPPDVFGQLESYGAESCLVSLVISNCERENGYHLKQLSFDALPYSNRSWKHWPSFCPSNSLAHPCISTCYSLPGTYLPWIFTWLVLFIIQVGLLRLSCYYCLFWKATLSLLRLCGPNPTLLILPLSGLQDQLALKAKSIIHSTSPHPPASLINLGMDVGPKSVP